MNLSELLEHLNTEETPYYGGEKFFEECCGHSSFSWVDITDKGFTTRPIEVWHCTDTIVGVKAIYFNEELICITRQYSHHGEVYIEWVSESVFKKVSSFVRSLMEPEDDFKTYINFDEEFEEVYKIESSGQLLDLHSTAIYQGKEVSIDWRATRSEVRRDPIATNVWVIEGSVEGSMGASPSAKKVNIGDLSFRINLK